MKISKENIKLFIPQREPFIMIDNLIEVSEDRFVTDFKVSFDNIFLERAVLREFALLENIAQSSAAGLGFLNKDLLGLPDGFIGGISNLVLYDLPRVNDCLHTVVTKLTQLGNMYLLKGESYVADKKLVECKLKLVGMARDSNE